MTAKRFAPSASGEFVGTQLDSGTDREQRATTCGTSTTPLSETLRGLPNCRDVTSEKLGTMVAIVGYPSPSKPQMSPQQLAEADREGEAEAQAWRKHRQRQRMPFKDFKA